jgi:hypothetical protein
MASNVLKLQLGRPNRLLVEEELSRTRSDREELRRLLRRLGSNNHPQVRPDYRRELQDQESFQGGRRTNKAA